MSNHILDSLTSRFQVLTRIEVARVFNQVLTDRSGHCQTQVGVDVDFANAEFASLQQHVFRYALSAVELAAVFVAFLNKGWDNGGSTMQNQRIARQQVGDFFQTSEVQLRFAFEFISAVAGADSDCQAVAAGAFNKLYSLIRIGVGCVFRVNLYSVFNASQTAQLSFYNNAALVSVFNNTIAASTSFMR